MNYLTPAVKQNYKLFMLLFNPHLNTLYSIWFIKQSKLMNLFLHNRWVKSCVINLQIYNQIKTCGTWTNKTYFTVNSNYQLIKYMNITSLNSNSNRLFLKTNIVLTPSVKSLSVYNSWLFSQFSKYDSKICFIFFTLNHFNVANINLLTKTFTHFQKLIPSRSVTNLTNLIHNIKFL